MTQPNYFSPSFIERMMQQHAPDKAIRVSSCTPFVMDNSASILAVLTAGSSQKMIGHFGLLVSFDSDGTRQTRRMVLKIKPHGNEIVDMTQGLAQLCGGPLATVYPAYKAFTGFQHTHGRELEIYGKLPSSLQPDIFGLFADPEQGAYLILMEYLEEVALMNSVMTPEKWTDRHIRQALSQMAGWHAQHLNKVLPLNPTYWDDAPSLTFMTQLMPLWEALLRNAAEKFPDLYLPGRVTQLENAIQSIPDYWRALERMPKTLIHNDFNPRNICFKSVGDAVALCVYDWELATYHVPQYDVIELLCFVLETDRYSQRRAYLEFYRQALHKLTGQYADIQAFQRGAGGAALDFGLHRLGLYMMAHSVSPYAFLPRVVTSYFDTLNQLCQNEGLMGESLCRHDGGHE